LAIAKSSGILTGMKQAAMWLMVFGFLAARVFGEPIVIKARMAHNRFVLPAKINDKSFHFLLDSACTIPTLHPEVVEELKLESSGSVGIAGIAGDEKAPTYRGVAIDFGEAKYAPRRIASIPSERSESRRRRDGVIGSGFFRQFVVEMDSRAKEIRLHSPTNFKYAGKGEIIPFRFRRGDEIPIVEASVVISNQPIKAEFEVDTGCDSGLCLGKKFVDEHKLLEAVESRSSEKFGIGGSVETKSGNVPVLRLGKVEVEKPQTDFFREGSPVEEPMVGHIGMGVFHRYKVILDYGRKQMIIEAY
jgi:hypothetical protein